MRLYLVAVVGSLALSFCALAGPDEDLYRASKAGNYAACEHALAQGANPNYVHQRSGQTPLWNAVVGNYERIVALILGAGGDANIPVTRVILVDEEPDPYETREQRLRSSARPRSQSVPTDVQPPVQRRNSVSSGKAEESPRSGSPRTPRRLTIRLETFLRLSPRKKEKEADAPRSVPELGQLGLCDEARGHSDSAPTSQRNMSVPSIASSIATVLTPRSSTPRSLTSTPRTPRQVVEYMRLPIHEAVERGCIDIVKLLLPYHGVQVVYEEDGTGTTLGDIALRSGHMNIYRLLREHENRALREHIRMILIPLHQAVRDNDFNLVEYILLHSNQLVDSLDARMNSPIEMALRFGHHQIAAMLVVHGAQMPEGFVDTIPRYVFLLRDLRQLYPRLAEGLIREMRRDEVADKDVARWLLSRLDADNG